MKQVGSILLLSLFLVAAIAVTNKVVIGEDKTMEFEEAAILFEQNATDGDVEAVLRIQSGDEGLRTLKVVGPNGSIAFEASCPLPNPMGLRTFVMESPEPSDQKALRAAFPEGAYVVTGESVSGVKYRGEVEMSHDLPAVVTFKNPQEDAEGVSTEGLTIEWSGVSGIEAYLLEIEQEETGVTLNVRLLAGTESFAVPEGFLMPDTEYVLAIGTQDAGGNSSFVEIGFVTAE